MGAPPQEGPSLSFGHSAPHPKFDPSIQCLSETFGAHRTATTDLPRLSLFGSSHEHPFRIRIATPGMLAPIPSFIHQLPQLFVNFLAGRAAL